MKKLFTIGILMSLCIQQFMLPIYATQTEQKTLISLLGNQSNYRNLIDKILGADMESDMSTRRVNGSQYGPIIRESAAIVRLYDSINTPVLKMNNVTDFAPGELDKFASSNRRVQLYRNYSYSEQEGAPGITDSRKSDVSDIIDIQMRSLRDAGIGRVWIPKGAGVKMAGNGELGKSSKWTVFYRWGKPIDHNITQAAHDEIQRYSLGWRELPLAPINPGYNGTPMEHLNSEANRQRDESFSMKDGKEIPDSELPFTKIMSTMSTITTGADITWQFPDPEFYSGDLTYFGRICYNEGPCGRISVKMWETGGATRTHASGLAQFKSDRSGYLYYDASFRPKTSTYNETNMGLDILSNITISASDLKEALKSVVWDSRGDPCETPDVTTDPVCKAAYGQISTSTTSNVTSNTNTTSSNPYTTTLSVANRTTLNTWITKNITSKETKLTSIKYSTFIEGVITKFKNLAKTTKNKNVLTKINYLIFELKQIKNNIEDEDSSFLDDIFN